MSDISVSMSFVDRLMSAIGGLFWLMDPFVDDLWNRMRGTTQFMSDIPFPIGFTSQLMNEMANRMRRIDRFMSDMGSPKSFVDYAMSDISASTSFVHLS